jgi:hypothetical protein
MVLVISEAGVELAGVGEAGEGESASKGVAQLEQYRLSGVLSDWQDGHFMGHLSIITRLRGKSTLACSSPSSVYT